MSRLQTKIGLAFVCLVTTILFAGCGYKVPLMNDPVNIAGKLTQGGKPLGNITLMLQPLENGHPVPLAVGLDGTFKGSAIPGKYAYYLVSKEDGSTPTASVDASSMQASMDRTVTIASGQTQLEVAL